MNFLFTLFSSQRMEVVEIHADLEGHIVNDVIIPSEIAMIGLQLDLVIIVEMTVPWDTAANMEAALTRKTDRYKDLCKDIEGNGFKC